MTRISSLPHRRWEQDVEELGLISLATNFCRTNNGTRILRPVQAAAIVEAAELGGLFGSIMLGGGKTDITGLAPFVIQAERPLLVLPAKLVQKTIREFNVLRQHWKIPHFEIKSYEFFSQKKQAEWLLRFKPDLIIFDEAHKVRNILKSAVARRFNRFFGEFPKTKCVALTATVEKDSILDFGHLLQWSLKDRAPVPLTDGGLETWALCLDVARPGLDIIRPDLSVLVKDLGPTAANGLSEARAAFADRLIHTPGVIVTRETFNEIPLTLEPRYYPQLDSLSGHWDRLRNLWIAPDDWPLGDAKAQVWATARDLSVGYFKAHVPWPPKEWMDARRDFASFVRRTIENSAGTLDTEAEVIDLLLSGAMVSRAWDVWRAIEPTHTVNRVTRWLTYDVIDFIIQDVKRCFQGKGGIVWTTQIPVAQELEKRSGWDYYGDMGLNRKGRSIESARRTDIVIASVAANGTGRNLQELWSRNYFTALPPTAQTINQTIGRTYRPGQLDSEVRCWYGVGCKEHISVLEIALMQANGSQAKLLQDFPLLQSGIELPRRMECEGMAFF